MPHKLTLEHARQVINENTEEIVSEDFVSQALVSVCLITYNHADFVEEAVDSILMQETDFPFEIVIGEDASSDETFDIVDRYQKKYPGIIKILRSTKNLGQLTGTSFQLNFIRNLRACCGKYIAFLEGDDYWLSPNKIQTQVEALEANAQHSSSFHDTYVKIYNNPHDMNPWRDFSNVTSMSLADIIAPLSPFHTSSFMARRSCINSLPSYFLHSQSGDLVLFIAAAAHGDSIKVNDVWSVYRKHPAGITNDQSHKGESRHEVRISMHKALRDHYRRDSQIDSHLFERVIKYHRSHIRKIKKRNTWWYYLRKRISRSLQISSKQTRNNTIK